jgi:hypothetical protein
MIPQDRTLGFLADLHRERIKGYRATRADHPAMVLHAPTALAAAIGRY